MKLIKHNFIFLCVEILLLISVLYVPTQIMPQACIIVADVFVVLTMFKIIRDGFKDIPVFFFNITYWIFVLGGCTTSIIKTGKVSNYISVSLTEGQLNLACGIALFGIACLDIVYFLVSDNNFAPLVAEKKTAVPSKLQKQVVVVIFAVAAVCKCAMAFESMTYSTVYGYVSLYTRESSNLPSVIRYFGAFFYFSLMLLLSCDFSKRSTYAAFGITALIEGMILNSGDRGEAVCGILILIIYTIFRCRRDPNFLIHKKLAIVGICCSLPFAAFALQIIKYTRVGNAADINFWDGFFEFFESQGVSINIISNEIKYRNEISKIGGHAFVIKQIASYLQQNVLFRTLFGFKKIVGNTVEMAMSGSSLGSTMMYIILPSSYLRGIGCGTCYLAELYQDASWIGLILGSVVIALLLNWIKKVDRVGWIMSAMMMNCMRIVLVLPRGAFFKWLTEILSVPNLMLLLLLLFLGYVSKRKEIVV